MQTYHKVVHEDVVRFPEVLLILSVVKMLTGRVILKLPPFPIVDCLTLAPKIPGIIHALGFFLDQDIVPKSKRQAASGKEHWKGKDGILWKMLLLV